MLVCESCAANYDENFSFCPYCGKSKLEVIASKKAKVNTETTSFAYEESTLTINFTGVSEKIIEYPFDWRPNVFAKLTRDTGRNNWNQIYYYDLQLKSVHPTRGRYIAFSSESFRAFHSPFTLSHPVKNMLLSHDRGIAWVNLFFNERKNAWDTLNNYLITTGWFGITKSAKKRKPPFDIQPDQVDTTAGIWKQNSQFDMAKNHISRRLTLGDSVDKVTKKYRYQRRVASS